MKLQRQLSKRTEKKDYSRYVVVIPDNLIEKSGFNEGDELEGEAKKGEIMLRKK